MSIFLSLSSCSYYAFYPQPKSQTYEATNPESIKVYSGDIEQDYIVIGSVASLIPGINIGDKYNERALKILKKHTAKLGADAIIHIKTNADFGGLSGVAIKFK